MAEWKEASFWFCLETNVETLNKRKDIFISHGVRLATFCERSPVELYLFYMSLSLASSAFPSIPSKSISSYSHFANQNFSSKSFRFGYLPIKITKANLSLIPDFDRAKYTISVPFFCWNAETLCWFNLLFFLFHFSRVCHCHIKSSMIRRPIGYDCHFLLLMMPIKMVKICASYNIILPTRDIRLLAESCNLSEHFLIEKKKIKWIKY